jgi:hypothetical protein
MIYENDYNMTFLATTVAVMMDLSIELWLTVDDVVMGGLSSGQMLVIDEGLVFQGRLSYKITAGFRQCAGGSKKT